MVINKPSSVEEFIDTYNHEKNHVEMHMCKEFGIDPYSEEAAYLSGQLAKKLFRVMLKSLIKNQYSYNRAVSFTEILNISPSTDRLL